MEKKIRVLLVASEAVPFAKTGGLADVAGALPKALSKLGHDVKVMLPLYRMVNVRQHGLKKVVEAVPVKVGDETRQVALWQGFLPGSGVEILFIDCPEYFDREALYVDPETGEDYEDNAERFALFSKAVLQALKAIEWRPNLIHCNDWQSGLIPAYLKAVLAHDEFYSNIRTVFSIHNIGYQGNFPMETSGMLGFPEECFHPMGALEFWGKVSYLKAGISFADAITTVSRQYAYEIQSSAEFGHGMEGLLRERSADLFGIVNGIDYEIWNPETDPLIAHRYGPSNLDGKRKNRLVLRKTMKLPSPRKRLPIIGIISRLADQKGLDLLAEIAEDLMVLDLQIVVLGTGDEKYHKLFTDLRRKFPEKVGVELAFDNKLAHQIEAGSDMFLMPSRYEPCGLNQLYSLKYGTVPIVRKTGGLADTIEDFDEALDSGTGFVFEEYDAQALLTCIKRAVSVYRDKEKWQRLMLRGMARDFSWEASASAYTELYRRLLQAVLVTA